MKTHVLAVALAMVFFNLTPAFAQDHTAHQGMNHGGKPAAVKAQKKKNCVCCESGKCPMMHKGADAMSGHKGMVMPVPQTRAEAESAAAMDAMHKAMAKPYTGDADADFIRGMIPHHQGAVDMARIVLKYGDDEQARELARRIIVAQKGEIAWMQRWLAYRQIPENGAFRFNR